MLFNTFDFILLFLPITWLVYFSLNKMHLVEASRVWLVLCSLFFYGYWNINYVILILISIFFNFMVGNMLSLYNFKQRRLMLTLGVSVNLAFLGYYKYTNFFVENINTLLNTNIQVGKIILPLAISFFTFQQIAYLVDSYKRETKEYDFVNYALFVTFFPQLIAGPIVHHKEIIPQFISKRAKLVNYKNLYFGLSAFIIGLAKKVIIADNLAPIVNDGFNNFQNLTTGAAWITSISYTFQLYFDFSGYCDMAYGAALMFNIVLPMNFNSPYQSLNIQDFWRRWHITLSKWLQMYVYIPLGGNRKGNIRTYLNLFIVFVICGIWHGAGWTFILWGIVHGLGMLLYRFYKNNFQKKFPISPLLSWVLTFNFVNAAWVLFRADNIKQAEKILSKMYDWHNYKQEVALLLLLIIILSGKNIYNEGIKSSYGTSIWIAIVAFISLVCMLTIYQASPFLYFNF